VFDVAGVRFVTDISESLRKGAVVTGCTYGASATDACNYPATAQQLKKYLTSRLYSQYTDAVRLHIL
jgi:hypothetical protein